MFNTISRRFSKQQQGQAATPRPEEYQDSRVNRKSVVLHPRSQDRSLTLWRKNSEIDVSSTIDDDDDDSCSLLYSDNEEVEQEFHRHRTLMKQSSGTSVQSSASASSSKKSIASLAFSFSSQRKNRRKIKMGQALQAGYKALVDEGTLACPPVVEISVGTYGGETNLDDILDSFARQHDPERPKILIPASNHNNQADDVSASSSVISRTRRKIAKILKKGRKGNKKRVACGGDGSCGLSKKGDDLDSLLARYRGSASCVDASNDGPPEQRVDTPKRKSRSLLPRSLHSHHRAEQAKREIVFRSPSSSDVEEEQSVNPAGRDHGYDCDTGSAAAAANLVDYKVLQRSEQRISVAKSSSKTLLHEPSSRVKSRMPVIDPLDIDRLLNKCDSEEEVIFFEQSGDDASTISSLTSGSSLTLSSGSPTSITDDRLNRTNYNSRTMANGKKKNLLDTAFGKHYSALPASRRLFKNIPEPPTSVTASPVAYNIPRSMQVKSHCTISVLLVEPKRKLFEIVSVDIARRTSVGDVLEKAREGADDSHIKRQTYVGLCNNTETTVNLKLPILKFLPSVNDKQRKSECFLSDDEHMKREMERRLLVALPSKATAPECIQIRSLLWKNPKLQTWWHNSAPLHRLGVA